MPAEPSPVGAAVEARLVGARSTKISTSDLPTSDTRWHRTTEFT
ncbi:MAG: hypothetical protein QOH74_2056, partial [Gaiellales bacterium]|nr:hypothetical protein [Gaiellales bacterium]